MNIYSVIKKDHDEARTMMEQILALPDTRVRLRIFEQLKVAILSHAKSEEKTFYQALKATGDKELTDEVPHFKEEHKEVESLFEQIEKLDSNSPLWWERFGELRQALLHHMKEEEKEVFPEAKKEIESAEASELGERMEVMEDKEKAKLKEVA